MGTVLRLNELKLEVQELENLNLQHFKNFPLDLTVDLHVLNSLISVSQS